MSEQPVKRPKCETVTCADGAQWTGFQFDEAYAYMEQQDRGIKALKDELDRVAPFLAVHGVEGYRMEDGADAQALIEGEKNDQD